MAGRNKTNYKSDVKPRIISLISWRQGFPLFRFFKITSKYTVHLNSVYHKVPVRWLVEAVRNVKIIESPLDIVLL